jgi:hypothetical protein
MPLSAAALITVSDAKAFLKESSTDNDGDIERRINGLSFIFEAYVGRKIKQQTLTDYRVDGNNKTHLILPFVPVQSLTKIDIRYSIDDTVYKTITDSSKWTLKDKYLGLVQLKEDVFIAGSRNVLLTMSVGYLATDLDFSQYQTLLLTQLQFDYRKWDRNEIGVTSRSLQDGNIGFVPSTQLLREVRDGLDLLVDRRFSGHSAHSDVNFRFN